MQPKDKITLNFIRAVALTLLENKNKLKVVGVTCSKSKKNTRTRCDICPELNTINTLERCQLRCSNVFVLNFENIIQDRKQDF